MKQYTQGYEKKLSMNLKQFLNRLNHTLFILNGIKYKMTPANPQQIYRGITSTKLMKRKIIQKRCIDLAN